MWLAVVDSLVDQAEVRAFWNSKDNYVLDAVPEVDRLWLGESRVVTPDEPRSPGAAGRVFDLLFLLGTTPAYQLPVVTDELIEQIVEAFDAGSGDELSAAPRPDLIHFLRERHGKRVAPDSRLIEP